MPPPFPPQPPAAAFPERLRSGLIEAKNIRNHRRAVPPFPERLRSGLIEALATAVEARLTAALFRSDSAPASLKQSSPGRLISWVFLFRSDSAPASLKPPRRGSEAGRPSPFPERLRSGLIEARPVRCQAHARAGLFRSDSAPASLKQSSAGVSFTELSPFPERLRSGLIEAQIVPRPLLGRSSFPERLRSGLIEASLSPRRRRSNSLPFPERLRSGAYMGSMLYAFRGVARQGEKGESRGH